MADPVNPYAQFAPQPAASAPAGGENPYAQFAPGAAPAADTDGPIMRKAKVLGSAALRGIASLPAMIGDGLYAAGSAAAGIPDDMEAAHAPNMMKNVQSVDVKNKTNAEKWLSSATEGAAGAMSTGPGALVRNAVTGTAAGMGAEAGERVAPGNPLARIAGGVAGGVGGGLAANVGAAVYPNARNLAAQTMEGITPAQLQQAQMVQALARRNGVQLDLAQALETVTGRGSNLTAVRDTLANSRHGDQVQSTLRAQPNQLETAADLTVGALPGPNWTMQQSANAVTDAATRRIAGAREARTNAVQPDYQQVQNLAANAGPAMIAALQQRLGQPGVTAQAREQMLDSIREIETRTAQGTVPMHGLDAAELQRSMRGRFKGDPLTKPDPKTEYQIGQAADDLTPIIAPAGSALERGNARYAQISRDVVDPLKQGPVGQMATPRGYQADKQTPVARMEALFSKGSDPAIPAAQRDINAFASEIRGIDRDAFPAAAKSFIRDRINKAIGGDAGQASSQGDPATAQKLYSSLFESRAQMQGMRDTAAGIARAYGLPEADVVRGLETFATITKAAANRPSRVAGLNQQEIAQQAGQNALSTTARTFGFLPFERIARGVEDAVQGATFRTFDDLLTSPEGAQTLARLGRTPVMSGKAQTILGTFFGLPATAPTESQ